MIISLLIQDSAKAFGRKNFGLLSGG